MPGSGADFDLVLRAAIWSGAVAASISVVLIIWILLLRATLKRRTARNDALIAAWRPILAESAMTATPTVLPALDRRELEPFLREWNATHDAVTESSRSGLNDLIDRLGVVDDVRALLRSARLSTKALATAAMGHLKDRRSWNALHLQLDSDSSILSLLSARALVEIDPAAAIPAIVPRIALRRDWPPGRVAALLRQAGAENVGETLCAAIVAGPTEHTVRLLPYVNEAPAPLAAQALSQLLRFSGDDNVVSACLRELGNPSLLPLARRYLTHPQWFVRLLAVEAVGRIGERDDVERIAGLLSDEQWWVRYRAAQALVHIPWLDGAELEAIQSRQQDRFARQILRQAISELKFQ
jgi:HEAT repeat protein